MLEAVRYAELEREDLSENESGTMIKSVWQLMDPCETGTRPTYVKTLIKDGDSDGFVRFTAHSHDNEPLTQSCDDILVYHFMENDGRKTAHYIVDRFCPKKII